MTNLSRLIASLAVISALTSAPSVLAAAETLRIPVMRPSGGISEVRYYDGDRLIAQDTVDELMRITKRTGAIPDGHVIENYQDGRLHFRWEIRDGRYDGLKQEYSPDGKLIAEWTLANGSKEGPAKTYYASGAVKSVLNYENNRLHGVCTLYAEDGRLKEKAVFVNGREDTAAREVYPAKPQPQPKSRQPKKNAAPRRAPARHRQPTAPRTGTTAPAAAPQTPQTSAPEEESAIQDTLSSTDPSFTPRDAGTSAGSTAQ